MAEYFEDWCAEATERVRFKPDRNAIGAELRAHYDDHCSDLMRLGYPARLAQQRALGPWATRWRWAWPDRATSRLGRLWQASWAVLAAAVLLAAMWLMDGSPWAPAGLEHRPAAGGSGGL